MYICKCMDLFKKTSQRFTRDNPRDRRKEFSKEKEKKKKEKKMVILQFQTSIINSSKEYKESKEETIQVI
ncbi:hypothetical protein V1477_013564 [Vespula maculifrons]|uniref:Uncharacterized protein n=1 Tax=Vespula maculifrons TaxID=7453 RepID=A0ABD2BPY7_VESMC